MTADAAAKLRRAAARASLLRPLRPAIVLTGVLTLLTGVAYPLIMLGAGTLLLPHQAGGSLVTRDGRVIGSDLIGQSFADPRYFWSRPSATTPKPYNAASSSGSNLGPTNPALVEAIAGRVAVLRHADPSNRRPIPIDLVTASGSGLDPDVSVEGARYQIGRVARTRGVDAGVVAALVEKNRIGRQFGFLGEPRINVLRVNRDLDALASQRPNPR